MHIMSFVLKDVLFKDVVGQQHIIKTLQNAMNRIKELESENGKLKSLIEEKHKVGNCEFCKRVWYSIWKND